MSCSCDSSTGIIIRSRRAKPTEGMRYACLRRPLRRPTCVARQLFDIMPTGSNDEAAWTPSGPDGISALLDDVIHHVLGFLPAHDALQMSALARRWRNHWMWMHSLRFAAVSGSVSVSVLKRLVGRLLLDIRSPLHECVIDIQGFYELTEEADLLIRHAVSECHVRILKVSLQRQVVSGQPLVSGHLVRLELHHVTIDGMILDFSSLTALEDVVMSRAHIHATKILSPSLKRLRMEMCYLFPSDSATFISAPSIVLMELDDLCVTTPLFGRMPLLETAFVRLGNYWPFLCEVCHNRYCCGVCASCMEFYFMELRSFSSARHLELTAPNVKNSPILEKLTLMLKEGPSGTYHALGQLPAISKCLKVVEIKCTKVDERLYGFFKILKNFLGQEHLTYNLPSGETAIL